MAHKTKASSKPPKTSVKKKSPAMADVTKAEKVDVRVVASAVEPTVAPVLKPEKRSKRKAGFLYYRNLRPVFILLLIPIAIGIATATAIASGLYRHNLADLGSKRLEATNWSEAKQAMLSAQPTYDRKFAYYKVKDGQDLASLAAFFSIDAKKLAALNPGIVAAGTTIKLPPIEKPYRAAPAPNGKLRLALVTEDRGIIRVSHKYRARQPIVTNIPELAQLLAPYGAIEKTGPTTYRINKPVSLDGDIRLDVTIATVTKLELVSTPTNVTCLCFDQSAVLFEGVDVVSYDPTTGKPDTNFADSRSFIRMKNGRMDIINSKFSYLGNALGEVASDTVTAVNPFVQEGGVYGVSWRISSGTLGTQTVTGWVEDSRFERNHFGAYTFGSSGMSWIDNRFTANDVYGLDPHDDSNGSLIAGNTFENNGKQGFIVSKRCNYNIIRNNISIGNGLHGYMLHQDSAYNLIENNIAYGNEDNYVIYASNYNTIRNNKSYAPLAAHIRVNEASNNTYIYGNELIGGKRGIFLYGNVNNTYVGGNSIHQVAKSLQTDGVRNTLFAENDVDGLLYDIKKSDGDSVVFGANTVKVHDAPVPTSAAVSQSFYKR